MFAAEWLIQLPIRLGFGKILASQGDLVLQEIPDLVIRHEIGAYLKDKLTKIREKYNYLPPSGEGIPSDWPTERDMQTLIEMAIPVFIFAATRCHFDDHTIKL